MKLFKIAFLPLLAGILLLPAASRPVRAAGSAAVEAGAGDRKRDKKKKQEADTAAKATPYEKLFKDKRVETVRGGGLTLHLTADKLYLELPDSLLGRGLMITTTIEWTGDPGDGLAHQQPVPPYMVEFGRGKSDTLLCMREFAPVVIVDGSPAMREAVGRSNIGPIVASYAVKARTPDGKSSVVDVTALFVGDVKRLRPIDPEGGNTYGGWMTAKADYKKDRSMLTGVTGGKGCVSVVGELSYGTTVSGQGVQTLLGPGAGGQNRLLRLPPFDPRQRGEGASRGVLRRHGFRRFGLCRRRAGASAVERCLREDRLQGCRAGRAFSG